MRRSLVPLLGAVLATVLLVTGLITWALLDDDGTAAVAASEPASLQGTWVTRVVTRDDVTRALRPAGLDRHAATVAPDLGMPTAWNVVFTRYGYLLSTDHGVAVDGGTWVARGSRLVLRPGGCAPACQVVYDLALTDDRFRLVLLDDDTAAVDGVPDEAYARALWTAVPFRRFAN